MEVKVLVKISKGSMEHLWKSFLIPCFTFISWQKICNKILLPSILGAILNTSKQIQLIRSLIKEIKRKVSETTDSKTHCNWLYIHIKWVSMHMRKYFSCIRCTCLKFLVQVWGWKPMKLLYIRETHVQIAKLTSVAS